MPVELKKAIPWGRNFEEYSLMFSLGENDLKKRILGCGDGPASFNLEATTRGFHVVSCDPIYAFSAEDIRERIGEVVPVIRDQMESSVSEYIWTKFRSINELIDLRLRTMNAFLKDYPLGKNEERYVNAELPTLPFSDREFDLALVSHFLFLYSAHFDLKFHIDSIRELLRVATEVRIYPLVTLASQRSPFLEPVQKTLESYGYQVTLTQCGYEFQKGATCYMKIHTS